MGTELVIKKLKTELNVLQEKLSQSQLEKNFFHKILSSYSQPNLGEEIFFLLLKKWEVESYAFYFLNEEENVLNLLKSSVPIHSFNSFEEKILLSNSSNPIISAFNIQDKSFVYLKNENNIIFYHLTINNNQKGIFCLFLKKTIEAYNKEDLSKIESLMQILSYYFSLQFKEDMISELKAQNYRLSMLWKKLNSTLEINYITQLLIDEMTTLLKPEGYIVSFLDQSKKNLFVKSLKFFEEQKEMEAIVRNTDFYLEKSEVNKICIKENRMIILNEDNYTDYGENAKIFFDYFKVKNTAFIPITNDEEKSSPIGVICVFYKHNVLSEKKIKEFQKNIALFYHPLKNSQIIFHIREKEKDIEKAAEKNKRILETVEKINKLSSLDLIYQNIVDSIINLFQFDLGLLFIEKNNFLKYSFGQCQSSDCVKDIFLKIDEMFKKEKGYEINVTDGATSVSFLQKKHFYFPNVKIILHLPMPPKDKKGIELLENPKTLLILPITKDEKAIGAIQLWSINESVHLSETDLVVLNLLCSFIGTAISNAELYSLVGEQNRNLEEKNKIIQQKNKQLTDELVLAREIQGNLVPSKMPEITGVQIAAYYKPMEEVGGDFYDFLPFRDNEKLGIFISDVSGHGVPAALITSMVKTLMETAGEQRQNPAEMLNYINQKITGLTGGNFLTAFYALYDSKEKKISFARGAHNAPILIRGNKLIELSAKGKILGIDKTHIYEQKEIDIQIGDKILFYTDGLTDATNNQEVMFEEFLPQVLLEHKDEPVEEYLESIYHALVTHKEGIRFEDDVCLMVMKITE